MIRYWLACVRWAIQRVGYWIRPYDTIADRRRWCWQPRTPCGWSRGIRIDSEDADG